MAAYLANPWIHGVVFGGALVTFLMTWGGFATWWERKFAARIQSRYGPVAVGPWGILQAVADVIKLIQKEHIVPRDADSPLYNLAPWLPVFLVLASAATVPFGGYFDEAGKWQSYLVVADLDVGILWVLALAGLMVFPIWMAGWASNNKYALLGGMRAVAQGISYEIPLVLSAIVPVVACETLSISEIIAWQAENGWLVWRVYGIGFVAFVVFFLASLAEANRIPFDIPEAESELVGGVLIEYTGIRMGIVMVAEYVHTLVASALAVALFFGGGHMPFLSAMLPWFMAPVWMILKTAVLFVFIYWVRWSWVRFRADQLMVLCWNWLVPGTLMMVMGTALMKFGGLL